MTDAVDSVVCARHSASAPFINVIHDERIANGRSVANVSALAVDRRGGDVG